MDKFKDEIVASIYETYDYGRFKVIKENRGRIETGGISKKRLDMLQWLIENDKWVKEESLVKVNKDFLICQGSHNYELAVANNKPVRWTYIEDHRFNNGTTKKQLLNHILMMNTTDTSYSKPEIFNLACVGKYQLALLIKKLIDRYDLKWTDVIALLTQEEDYFSHAAYSKYIDLETFDNEDYIKMINHHTFRAELNYLVELMELFKGTHKKGMLLRSTYSIINKAKDIVDSKKFRESILELDKDKLSRFRPKKLQECVKYLIHNYNQHAGKSVEHTGVMFEIRIKTSRRNRKKQELLEA